VNQVAQGIQQAVPAIQEVITTVQNAVNDVSSAFPSQNTNTNTNTNTTTNTTPTENNADNNAQTQITNAGDQETPTQNTPTTTAPTNASAAEAALANYQGGRLSPAEFGRLFGPVARESQRRTGVPASIVLAQAALETGWGGSTIGDAKNLFGIKGTGPAGSVNVPTREFLNGRMVTINDSFRKYNTWAESIEDHGRLLQNSRYSQAMANRNDPDQFARELQRAGYATDPEYANKLISIMRSNNFYQYNN
jgi:flagellum-specific peptidoglycan hydrolase FlgJ